MKLSLPGPKARSLTLLLVGSLTMMLAFQNADFIDRSEALDIRDIAPRRPAGYIEPGMHLKPVTGTSPQAVGQQVLDNQLSPIGKDIETYMNRMLHSFVSDFDSNEDASGELRREANAAEPESRLQFRFLSANAVQLAVGDSTRFNCSGADGGLQMSMEKSLSHSSDISFKLDPSRAETSLKFSMSW
jgi:hypothetical protein